MQIYTCIYKYVCNILNAYIKDGAVLSNCHTPLLAGAYEYPNRQLLRAMVKLNSICRPGPS